MRQELLRGPFPSKALRVFDGGVATAKLAVVGDKTFGFIDRHGRECSSSRYWWAAGLSNGFVEVQSSEWSNFGFANRQGVLVCGKQLFTSTCQFLGDVFSVRRSPERNLWVNADGDDVTPQGYDFLTPIRESRSFANEEGELRLFLIDSFGEKVCCLADYWIGSQHLSEGMFWAWKERDQIYLYAIDKDGNVVLEIPEHVMKIDLVRGYSEGLAAFCVDLDSDGDQISAGFLNKAGEVEIPQVFSGCYSFSEGLAAVRNEAGQWGFINKTGEYVIAAQFEAVEPFANGKAAVQLREDPSSWTYVDMDGCVVTDQTFFAAHPFSEGLALVEETDDGCHSILKEDGTLIKIKPRVPEQMGQ